MENENLTKDKTYTLNSSSSYFNVNELYLKILLPQNDESNPYIFRSFDVSQIVDGKQCNAIFVYMRKTNDNGDDLSPSDDDTIECNCICDYGQLTQLNGLPNFSAFDPSSKDGLVIVYHDTNSNTAYQETCAEKAFDMIPSLRTEIMASGNHQTELNLMGDTPKKTGMSTVPKF